MDSAIVYNFGVLAHFDPWGAFGLVGIYFRQEKLSKFTKILNYNKSSCIIFCVQSIIYIIHKNN